jgi:hypothetical protein
MAAQHTAQTPPLVWRRPSGQYLPGPAGFTVRGHAPLPAFRDPREVLDELREVWSAQGWIIRWHQPTCTWIADRGDMTLKRSDPIALRAALKATRPPRYGTTAPATEPRPEGTDPR